MVTQVWGAGVRAVLVHGSLATGPLEWEAQRPLVEQGYQLVIPTRRAYVSGTEGEDFVADGADVAALLEDGAHLVGHSYGALAALVAARSRPEAVRSLVLAEPPLFAVAADHPDVVRMQAELQQVLAEDSSDREFLTRFLQAVGTPVEALGPELVDELVTMVRPLRLARQPWESPPSADHLAASPFPVVVVSGDHHPGFSAVCEALARVAGGRPAVVAGAGHEVQLAPGFNDVLLATWSAAEHAGP